MSVQDALQATQRRGIGKVNQASLRYAETLISSEDTVLAAAVANVATQKEHFPGVVILTDRQIIAVCGLPGIKRVVSLNLERLEQCAETTSLFSYKAVFRTKESGFSLTVSPEVGERFSRQLALLRGEAEEFDAVTGKEKSSILNPILERNLLRRRQARKKENARRKAEREAAAAQLTAERNGTENGPQAVAARLAAELQKEN